MVLLLFLYPVLQKQQCDALLTPEPTRRAHSYAAWLAAPIRSCVRVRKDRWYANRACLDQAYANVALYMMLPGQAQLTPAPPRVPT